jgi:hypothetical protein
MRDGLRRPGLYLAPVTRRRAAKDGTRLAALARAAQRWGTVTLVARGKLAVQWVAAELPRGHGR